MAVQKSFKNTVNYFSLSALDAIQTALGKNEEHDPFKMSTKRGIAFLEIKCSGLYGFQTDVSPNENMDSASLCIPRLFDNAFLLPLLIESELRQDIIDNLVSQMEYQRKSNGLWNYFYQEGLMAEDVDSNAIISRALLAANGISKEDSKYLAETILPMTVQHEDGVIDMYLQCPEASNLLSMKKLRRRVDLGSSCNFAWLLAQAGLDTGEKFAPTLRILDDALNDLLSCSDFTTVIPNALYYTSQDVIIFLFSSYIISSQTAQRRFKARLVQAVKARFKSIRTSTNIACRILSGLYLELHKDPEILEELLDEARTLISMQCEDGSFQPHFIYQWRYPVKAYYGSSAFSTALAVGALECLRKAIEK